MSTPRRAVVGRLVLLALALAAGCATVSTDDGFRDVQALVKERSGRQIEWQRGADAEGELARAAKKLLHEGDLTVEKAVQAALIRNPRLGAVYEELGIAQADVVRAGLLRNPVLDGAVRWGVGSPEIDLTLTQEFLSILFLPMRTRIAAAQLDVVKAQVAARVLQVEAATRESFYGVQAEMQLLEMRQEVRTATSASFEFAKALREAGNIKQLDVDAERILFDRAQLAVAMSQSAVVAARERLNVAMGAWGDDTSWKVASRMPEPSDDADLSRNVERRAIDSSLELMRLRSEAAVASREAELAGASRGAQDAEAGVSADRADSEWGVGPALKLPIPLFDQGQAGVARALAILRQHEQEIRSTAIEVRAAARAAAQRFVTARAVAIFHRDEMLPAQTRILDATLLEYNAMQLGVFQLLSAKQQQIEAGQSYIEALREYWLARTALEQILRGAMPHGSMDPFDAPQFGERRGRESSH